MEHQKKYINLYRTKKQEGKEMQIILQHGFITFVRNMCNRDYGTTELFTDTIQDYFFTKKEIPINTFEGIDSKNKELSLYTIEGIFCPTKDIVRLQAGFMDRSELSNKIYEIIKKEEIIMCVKLFRLMLMKIDISLYLVYEKGDFPNRTINSSEIFLYEETFYELLINNFEKTMNGAYVKYIEKDLQNAMNIFFKQYKKDDLDYILYRKNEDADLFFKLYVEKDIEGILMLFPKNENWRDNDDADSDVSKYIQKTYQICQTKVKRYVMPMLSAIREFKKEPKSTN